MYKPSFRASNCFSRGFLQFGALTVRAVKGAAAGLEDALDAPAARETGKVCTIINSQALFIKSRGAAGTAEKKQAILPSGS
jgi:hypothetical protein